MTTRNDVTGDIHGYAVQAGYVAHLNLASMPAEREYRPMQLPPSPSAFVNRVEAIRRMDHALSEHEHGATLFVLTGMAGVGKTAVAVHWAHANRDRFSGGVLYSNLADHRDAYGGDVGDLLWVFLRALGVNEQFIPPTHAERIALFRTRTAVEPLLVVLDGVDEPAQARSVIPGASGSVVVVTSRRRLAGLVIDGAEFIDVGPLNLDDSTELMTKMVTRVRVDDGSALSDLVRLCSGLPLALLVAGAGLARHRRWPVARLVRYLSDDRERLARLEVEGGSVGTVFDLAYEELPADVRRLYCCLGSFPGQHFSLAVVAAAARLDEPTADDLVESLCQANLLEEVGADRYRFHDLIRLHARRRAERDLSPEDRTAALRRVVEWYELGAAAADVAVLGGRWRLAEYDLNDWRGRFDASSALRWLEDERPNLLALMRVAIAEHWHDSVWHICDSLWALYHSKKFFADWIEAHELAISVVRNNVVEAHLRNRLARAYIETHDFRSAEEQLEHALRLTGSEKRAVAVVMESQGLLYREQERYQDAVDVFSELAQKQRAAGDRRAFALQSYQLGDVLVRARRADEAVPVLTAALDAVTELRDEKMVEARVRIALGAAYVKLHQYTEAQQELEAAVDVTHEREQPVKEAQALEELVRMADEQQDVSLFQSTADRLRRLYLEVGDPRSAVVQRWLDNGARDENG